MKKFMRNCAITALCLIALGLVLTIATGSYIGKKAIKDTVKTVMDGALDTIHSANDVDNVRDELQKETEEIKPSQEDTSGRDLTGNSDVTANLFEAENASEAVAALQSLDDETKEEFLSTLESSLDAKTMEKVKRAMEGLLTEEELTELLEELNGSLDLETKLEIASQLAGVFGEEEMETVTNALENVVDEDAVDNWADGLSDGIEDFFSENFWKSVNEAEFDIEDSIVFNDSYEVLHGDVEKFPLGSSVTDVSLNVGGASFHVKESTDEQYHVEAESVSKFQAYIEDECLYIKTLKSSTSAMDVSKVTLYVPEVCQLDSLSVDLGAGEIALENINAAKQNLTVGAGQITLKNVEAQTLTVEVGMGELIATGMNVDNVNAEVGMGHMLLKGAINQEANIECAMGSVEVECEGTEADFNYDIDGAMGEVKVGNRQYAGVAQEQKINNNASKNMKLECAMGSLVIDFEN